MFLSQSFPQPISGERQPIRTTEDISPAFTPGVELTDGCWIWGKVTVPRFIGAPRHALHQSESSKFDIRYETATFYWWKYVTSFKNKKCVASYVKPLTSYWWTQPRFKIKTYPGVSSVRVRRRVSKYATPLAIKNRIFFWTTYTSGQRWWAFGTSFDLN